MRIIRVLAAAGTALLASTALAHADPISIAILGFLGVNAVAGSLIVSAVTFGLTTLASIGLSLLQAALNKPKTPGVSFEVEIGDDSPIGFCSGSYATPGTRKYLNTYKGPGGTPNGYLVDVIQYGDLPSYGTPGLWVNGKKATLLTGEVDPDKGIPIEEFRKNGRDHLWVRVKDGTSTVVDAYLDDKFGDHADLPWTSDMIGRGCPHLIVTARFAPKVHKSQPQLLIEPPPQRWYDLRKDTTAGGSGAHRWDNQATWEPTVNPVVQIYNIIRGVYYGDEWVYGGQNLSAYRLPASNWMAAANECDVEVGDDDEPQFRAGIEIRGDMEPLAIVEELLKACSGRLAEVGGRFKILVGAPAAAVYSFDDGGIVVTREQGYRPFPRLDETINGIEATYPEPGEMWAQKDAPPRYSDTLEAEDAGFRLASGIQFNAVPFGMQVQRQMETMIAEERRFRIHTLYLPPEAYPVEPLDVLSWSSARNGYTNKKFLVRRAEGEPGMNQLVVLKEIDPADYGGGGDYTPVDPIPPGMPPPEAQANPTFDAIGYAVQDGSGTDRRPSIKVFYAGDLDDVRAVRVQVRLEGDDEVIYNYNIPYGEPDPDGSPLREVVLNGTFLPDADYEVNGELVPVSQRDTEPSAWIDVTTPDVRLGEEDLYPIELGGLGEDVRQMQIEQGRSIRSLMDEAFALATQIAAQDFAGLDNMQTLRRELVSTRDTLTASYRDAIVVATGPSSAIALRVEALEVKLPGLASSEALNSTIVRVDGIGNSLTALGEIVTGVSSTVGNFSAAGKFRVTTEATPVGALARIGISVAATAGDVTSTAAIFLDALAGGLSRIVLDAPNLYFGDLTSGAAPINPLIYTGGQWYAQNFKIGSAIIEDGAITSTKRAALITERLAA